mgnify:FL=1|jgi:hypothetical protein
MSTGTTKSPNLPVAPREYDAVFFEQFTNVLRLYFAQLDNPGFSAASGLNLDLNTLPTQTSLADLRAGDVYRDTTAGNVLKVKV